MPFLTFRSLLSPRQPIRALVVSLLALTSPATIQAANIAPGDVTTALGPTFFVDDAVNGGGDTDINQPNVASYTRYLNGLITRNQGPARVALTGFGFALHTNAAFSDATSVSVTFTYLGADEAIGGGDDVSVGTAIGGFLFISGGEYVFAFDSPLTADLNITGTRFRIQLAPTNAGGDGSLRMKTGALTYETASGPKFSVAGFVAPRRVNLAKFQPATTDSVNGQRLASYATDGVSGNDNLWQSNGSGPHWARVDFPFPVEVGSAQVFTGVDDTLAQANFRIQYLVGASWLDAPGAVITGNTNVERNIVFTNAVTASSFRVYSTDGTVRIRELALYPSNSGNAFAAGTDLGLNLAQQRPVIANANTAGNFPLFAVDGRVNKDSKWQTTTAGANWLEIDLIASTKIGSAHFYSGSPGVAPLADFLLKYWDGAAWQDIPGGSVTGNGTADLVVSFTTPVTTTKVRLEFTNPGTTSVRELCVFPANNGNTGYPVGTGVTGVPPSAAKADDFTDSFYQLNNPAAGLSIAVNNGAPALAQPGLTTAQGQYQILLNISNGTYRLRNRATGNCLSGAQLSTTPGLPLTDAPYSALPHQDWILDPLDSGAFQLINQWSGLVLDIQGGGTAAGTPLVQNAASGSASQRWQPVFSAGFPKKGVGGGNFATSYNANWMYNWGLSNSQSLPAGAVFQPMQWGNYNWTFNTSASSTWKLYPTWRTNSMPLHLMGFNEPDTFSQSGNSLDTENTNEADFSTTRAMETAVELWPRLQSMDLPLVAPCPANMTNGWLADFYTRANARGYRVDYTAKHSYGSPGNGSADGLISGVLEGYTLWGKPMWLTEFSFVDWSGNSSWSEEDNYNCLAEFLWRAESLPWLRKYALFVFTEDANNPQPANPWQDFTPAPRSNSRDINGNLTAFGKLYAAWDNDAVVRTDKAYQIHNKNTRKRLANNTAQSNAAGRNIRVDGPLVHWTLAAAPTAGRYHVISSLDGRRLSTDGTAVSLVAAGTTGTPVEWTLAESQHGWHYLGNPASSKRLKMVYNNSTSTATYSMVATSSTGDDVQWRFIVPPQPPVWTGTVSNSWTDASNWSPGIVPAAGDAVAFNSASIANLATMLDQDFNLSGISLADPAGPVLIGGTHTLTLGGGGVDLSSSTRDLTITAPVVLDAAQNWSVGSGRVLSLGGAVSGNHELTVSGAGRIAFGASNLLPNGAAAGNLIVDGMLDLNGTSQSINGLGGTGTIDNTNPGTGSISIGNNDAVITLNALLQNTNGSLALVKTGAGTLTFSTATANAHGGGFTNTGTGFIYPKNNASFGTGPVVMNGSTLYAIGGVYTFANALTLNGATLRVGGGSGRSVTWNGPVTIAADSTIQADGSTSGITLAGGVTNQGFTLSSAPNGTSNTISGPISGTGTIMAATYSNGALLLNAANPFSGTYRSALGFLKIGDPLALQNGTLDMNAADAGSVNLNNLNATLGALTGSRNLSLGSGTVSIGNNHASTSYSGALSGSGSLVKTGNGTLTLSGSNIYTGSTSVHAGTLALGANDALPGTAVILGNATLDAAAFTDTVGTLDVTSTARIHLGGGGVLAFANSSAIDWSGGSLDITGNFIPGVSLRFGTTSGGLTPAQLSLITVNGAPGAFVLNAAGFLAIALPSGYASWQSANGTSQPADLDHDHDGVQNGVEFFLGGSSDTTGITPLPAVIDTAGILSVTWIKSATGYEGVYPGDFLVETTTTLGGAWTPATLGTGAGKVEITGNSVKYTFPPGTTGFARLKVTGP